VFAANSIATSDKSVSLFILIKIKNQVLI